jgi:hypothetical protein
MSLLPEIGGGGVHHCSSPTYKEYLTAVENGCEYIQYPSDNKKGFTKVRIKDHWRDKFFAWQKFKEAWQCDDFDSGAVELEACIDKVLKRTVFFKGHYIDETHKKE